MTEILSYGQDTCGSFVQASPAAKQLYLSWVVGFITGENMLAVGEWRLIGQHWNSGAFLTWLNTYCTAHPLESFLSGAQALRESERIQEGIK